MPLTLAADTAYGSGTNLNSLVQEKRSLAVGSEGDINTAFATLVAQRADALFVTSDALFFGRRDPIVAVTGGLMS